MLRFIKRGAHSFVRRHIHTSWMVASIRVWAGMKSFVHSLLVFLGFLYLVVSTASYTVYGLAHYLTISKNWDRIQSLKIEQLVWQDMVILAAIPAFVTCVVSIYTASS